MSTIQVYTSLGYMHISQNIVEKFSIFNEKIGHFTPPCPQNKKKYLYIYVKMNP